MSFDTHHYMPVLKIKRGEKAALQRIAASNRPRITPLLEIVERKDDKSLAAHLDTAFKGLAESVSGYGRCLLDVHEILGSDGSLGAAEVFRRAANAGIAYAPVIGLTQTAGIAAALNHQDHGLALRLSRLEFEGGGLNDRILAFFGAHGLRPNDVDLIVDLGPVEELIVEGIAALSAAFIAEVPYLERWRTVAVAACAFPLSMAGVNRNSQELVQRAEWIAWKDHLHARRDQIERLPIFSDYAIQHPSGVEGFDPRFMKASASIRYATPEEWLLIKGESTGSIPAVVQFPDLATRLVYGHLRRHFAGPSHCDGCASMKKAADGAPRHGSPEIWRKLGTIHHISVVMQELGSLSWP